jgi:hypothetical protein
MSGRWFRMYASIRHDPKVQRLPLKARWALIMMWTLAAENDGVIPEDHLDYELGLKPYQCSEVVNLLLGLRLLERDFGKLVPHNWRGRQYVSDNSTPRTRAYKERERSRAVPGTPPETETETETETDKTPKPPKGATAEFERFWKIFPNKIGKAAAMKAFAFARKRGASAAEIVAGVERYVQSKPRDRPWCNPSTFLNQERWLDEPAPEVRSDNRDGMRVALDKLGGNCGPRLGSLSEFLAIPSNGAGSERAISASSEQRTGDNCGETNIISISKGKQPDRC